MTSDQQISILWHACHGLLPPWAQKLDVPVVAPFVDIYADKLIPARDKELAEKLVSIGVSRGGLWSRCMAVRAIVEADSESYRSAIETAIARLEEISDREGVSAWRNAKEILGADLFHILQGLRSALAE